MRMREFSEAIPKPMVPVGPRPVLWHLMRYYAHFGHTDFVLALGYNSDYIKRYFLSYEEWVSNDFVLQGSGEIHMLNTDIGGWTITFVDTGLDANIGERLCAVRSHLDDGEMFLANYGDGLSDVRIDVMIDELERTDAVGNFACVRPSQSVHVVELEGDHAVGLVEAADIRDVGQRRILRVPPRDLGLHPPRGGVGLRAVHASDGEAPASRPPPRGILDGHGHLQGSTGAR